MYTNNMLLYGGFSHFPGDGYFLRIIILQTMQYYYNYTNPVACMAICSLKITGGIVINQNSAHLLPDSCLNIIFCNFTFLYVYCTVLYTYLPPQTNIQTKTEIETVT